MALNILGGYNMEGTSLERLTENGFEVHDLRTAGHALKRIAEWKKEVSEKEEYAKEEISKIENWLEKDTKATKESIAYFETLLTNYQSRLLAAGGSKTLSTPYGKVKSITRKKKPKIKEGMEEEMKVCYDEYSIPQEPKFDWDTFKSKLQVKEEEDGTVRFFDEDGIEIKGFLEMEEENTTYKVVTE